MWIRKSVPRLSLPTFVLTVLALIELVGPAIPHPPAKRHATPYSRGPVSRSDRLCAPIPFLSPQPQYVGLSGPLPLYPIAHLSNSHSISFPLSLRKESVGVILRWPRSRSRVAELKFVKDRWIGHVFFVMGDQVCGPRSRREVGCGFFAVS